MSGLGQVGGPSRPPTSPSGVIAGNARTACCCCSDADASLHRAAAVRVKELALRAPRRSRRTPAAVQQKGECMTLEFGSPAPLFHRLFAR
jgi:hypothetical protein